MSEKVGFLSIMHHDRGISIESARIIEGFRFLLFSSMEIAQVAPTNPAIMGTLSRFFIEFP